MSAGEVHEDLLGQHAHRRDGGDQEGVAAVAQHGGGAHRQHQQDAESARDSVAGVENERDRDGIDAGVHQRHPPHAGPGQAPGHDHQHAHEEIRRRRP